MKKVRRGDRKFLEELGIVALTGEACGIGMRILCDLTPDGVELVEEFLGGTVEVREGTNWNSRDGQVGSALLSRGMLEELVLFALCKRHERVVEWGDPMDGYTGMTVEELDNIRGDVYRSRMVGRVWACWGTCGARNRHEMSGRVE